MMFFSSTIKSYLSSDKIEAFYLLRILNSDGSIIYSSTSCFCDILLTSLGVSLGSNYLYSSNSSLKSVDLPQLSTSVDREQYKISIITNPTDPQMNLAVTNLIGKTLETRIGFVNTTTGFPDMAIENTIIVYRGRVESAGYTFETSDIGESTLQLSGSSPIVNLDQKNGLYLSRDSIKHLNANDTCCDQIYESSSAITLKWGKK
jgi:hypothetical protein